MKKYGVIVFDLGNTLIRFDHTIAARKIADLFRIDEKKIYDLFFDSELTRAFEKGSLSPEDFHKKITAFLGFNLPFVDFVPIWNDIFWEDEDCCDIARQLKKSYRLFLLSNVNRLHFEHIRKKFDIIKIFDELILSFALGAMKPEKRIYEYVVDKAGCDKGAILYIDDREDLVREAQRFGIDSVRFEGAEKLACCMKNMGILP